MSVPFSFNFFFRCWTGEGEIMAELVDGGGVIRILGERKRDKLLTTGLAVNSATTRACYVYTSPDCKGDFAEVRSDVQDFQGYYHNGVRSFQCFAY